LHDQPAGLTGTSHNVRNLGGPLKNRNLNFDQLDSTQAEKIMSFVRDSTDLAASIDDPSLAGDLGRRITEARDRNDLTSLEDLNRIASGPDEFEAVVTTAFLGQKLSRLRRRRDLANRQVGLDLVLLDPVTNKVHILNATATAAWYHITPDRSLRNIIDALEISYPQTNPPSLVLDVLLFLEELSGIRLLTTLDVGDLPVRKDVPEEVIIPDREISSGEGGYAPPAIKSFDVSDLEARYSDPGDATVLFADTCQSLLSSGWASDPNGPRAKWADRHASAQ
jgi:hypothetical protein